MRITYASADGTHRGCAFESASKRHRSRSLQVTSLKAGDGGPALPADPLRTETVPPKITAGDQVTRT